DLRIRILIEIELSHVRDDANDLPRRATHRVHLAANRVLAEEAALRERLIDQHHLRTAGDVLLVEHPACDEAHAHHLQEVAADDAGVRRLRQLPAVAWWRSRR